MCKQDGQQLYLKKSYLCYVPTTFVMASVISAASGTLDPPPDPHLRERSERDDQPEKSGRPMGELLCSLLQTVPKYF